MGMATPQAGGTIARVKPHRDILTAVETICGANGITGATIRGSLVGARFSDGGRVDDRATEVSVRQGRDRNGRAALALLVPDMNGEVHERWLERGENPVCITFDPVPDITA